MRATTQSEFTWSGFRDLLDEALSQLTYKVPAHPMKSPPLFQPFPTVQYYGEQYVCVIDTRSVEASGDMEPSMFPETPPGCSLADEFGMMHHTTAVTTRDGDALVLGVDPLYVAWLMRLTYTAVQCDQSLPQTLPMLQIVGRTKVTDAVSALPGMGGEGWGRLVSHLMFGTQPWCTQFQRGLRAALDPLGMVDTANVDDQRLVYVSRDKPLVPLLQMVTGCSQGQYVRKVRNITAFWREAHPVAMDWGAVL